MSSGVLHKGSKLDPYCTDRQSGAQQCAWFEQQAAFHVFGMELLVRLDLHATNQFFSTFFRLPGSYWRGFLASRLSSGQLMAFAAVGSA